MPDWVWLLRAAGAYGALSVLCGLALAITCLRAPYDPNDPATPAEERYIP
jgi:hypothetical protein